MRKNFSDIMYLVLNIITPPEINFTKNMKKKLTFYLE